MTAAPQNKWLIWSHEHKAWWRPASNGYTEDRNLAGRYELFEAMEICRRANEFVKNPNHPEETMVPE